MVEGVVFKLVVVNVDLVKFEKYFKGKVFVELEVVFILFENIIVGYDRVNVF